MKIQRYALVFAGVLALLLSGCREPNSYEIVLYPDETLSRGDPVFLNGEPVAKIEDIYLVNNELPLARVRLVDKRLEGRFVQGIQRKPERNVIHLELPHRADEAAALMPNSRIPLRNSPLPPTLWPPNQNTVILTLAFLALIIVFCFILKSLLGTLWLTATFAVATIMAYVSYPLMVPYMAQAMDLVQAQGSSVEAGAETDTLSGEEPNGIQELIPDEVWRFVGDNRINSHVASFGVVFIGSSVLLGALFGWVRKRVTK